eukprot:CAMPEP_0203948382 /NCGR_PEP_ID=MMETSP0359-20131031/83048_1 /ASSEMBLY_ACC=CAM_ASM_000338 /TAXON_ID=268821 /ORGANISM="Scrippsiella Hangoei, Strain SHTV-5" /LENGTH=884 /DNA_ID=CAMNT_0050879925 /DNA_START=88 /DNA_END=2742 /DNA_ORIENTATION=+
MASKEDLEKLKVADLKKLCKDKGLIQGGTKAELVERLSSHADKEAAASSAPEKKEEAKASEEAPKEEAEEKPAEPAKAAAPKEEVKPAEKAVEVKKPEPKAPEPKAPEPKAPELEEPEEEQDEEEEKQELATKKRDPEADARRRRIEKRKKLKEKKKVVKAEESKDKPAQLPKGKGKGLVKGKGKGMLVPARVLTKKEEADDDIEVDYVMPDILEGSGMQDDEGFAAIVERFKKVEPEEKEKDEDEEEDKPRKRTRPKTSLLEEAEDSSDDEGKNTLSKKKRKVAGRVTLAELKTLVKRPDVVEVWDTTSEDPRLLVYLKAYRNTVNVPKHWSSKRKYMAGKRGVEKPPFKLPEFIEATGIAKIRQSILEKQAEKSLKGKSRDKAHPKMGKLDIDYQVLHDAFFKFAKPPKMSKHNDLYYEGKEYEAKMNNKKPGLLSAALKEALGMAEGSPPPWLINMQRYGPPPAYPNLKVPGLNAPIPQGAEYGYHPGGWGKPPVDEFGNPLYGDWRAPEDTPAAPEDTTLWGEVDEDYEEDDDDEVEGAEKGDGTATPMLGTATPLVGSGSATPVVSRGGMRSISGVSSITSGLETPGAGSRSKRGGIASVSGVSSASLTPTPQLFQVLEEQKARGAKGMVPSSHTYKMRSRTGGSTPMGGVGSSGTGTPLAGIGTPIAGIGTPHGISTPHGIGTPGNFGTRSAVGTHTPHGIGTPVGYGGVGTPHGYGTHTPHGIGTPAGGIGTPHVGGIATPIGGIATPIGGIATPIGGIATPIGGISTPIGGIATPIGGIATPMGGFATPVGGIATPTGIPGMPSGGMDTPGPVTMSLNVGEVETEGILTADIIRHQLKQHEDAAAKAKIAAGQKEVEPRKGPAREKKRKDKTKFKF